MTYGRDTGYSRYGNNKTVSPCYICGKTFRSHQGRWSHIKTQHAERLEASRY